MWAYISISTEQALCLRRGTVLFMSCESIFASVSVSVSITISVSTFTIASNGFWGFGYVLPLFACPVT